MKTEEEEFAEADVEPLPKTECKKCSILRANLLHCQKKLWLLRKKIQSQGIAHTLGHQESEVNNFSFMFNSICTAYFV